MKKEGRLRIRNFWDMDRDDGRVMNSRKNSDVPGYSRMKELIGPGQLFFVFTSGKLSDPSTPRNLML